MISPLNINRMVRHKLIHNNMWSRTSVIDVSDNMQMTNRQTLNQFTHSYNEFLCPSNSYNRTDNCIIIRFFIRHIIFLCDQFLDHISKIRRKCFSYFRSGIFTCCSFTHLNQAVQRNLIPVLHILLRFLNPVHLLFRIINKSSKGLFIPATHSIPEYIINFTAH